LWRSPLSSDSASVFDHSSLEPFANQHQQPPIRNPVFQKLEHPAMIDFVEK